MKDSQMWIRCSKYKPAFEFMELVNSTYSKKTYITSNLAISEVVTSIYREIKYEKMYLDGIPFGSFRRFLDTKDFELDEEDMRTVRGITFTFLQEYGLFDTTGKKRKIQLTRDDHIFLLIADLILKKDIDTHDSILVSSAIGHGCDTFVTSDGKLISNVKRGRLKQLENVAFLTPREAVEILTKENNKNQRENVNSR